MARQINFENNNNDALDKVMKKQFTARQLLGALVAKELQERDEISSSIPIDEATIELIGNWLYENLSTITDLLNRLELLNLSKQYHNANNGRQL
ncbi:unnamed protein product [Rotaria sp. Silwood1]|nr:unnamed protein product [Rotaria sp. Silwood1]CAF1594819.1 unnamed protein product [Rotaria sp. Silwood1]